MRTDKERIATLEAQISQGKMDLQQIEETLSKMAGEIKQVKSALYLMVLALAANIPQLAHLSGIFKAFTP